MAIQPVVKQYLPTYDCRPTKCVKFNGSRLTIKILVYKIVNGCIFSGQVVISGGELDVVLVWMSGPVTCTCSSLSHPMDPTSTEVSHLTGISIMPV